MMEVAIRRPKRGTACSRQINRVLREAPAGSRIVFEPGEYLIDEKLLLCDRKKLFLDGAGGRRSSCATTANGTTGTAPTASMWSVAAISLSPISGSAPNIPPIPVTGCWR